MRSFRILMLLVLALSIPSMAHADTFVLAYGGNTFSFDLPTGPPTDYFQDNGTSIQFSDVPLTNTSGYIGVYLYDDLPYQYYFDLQLQGGPIPGEFASFIGPILYAEQAGGDVTYTPGTYHLTGHNNANGVLIIDGGGASTTPEPSSLLLLGTGILSVAAAARRRLTRA